MSRNNLLIVGLVLLTSALGCSSVKSLLPGKTSSSANAATVDLEAPAKPVDVKVQLDKKQTSSATIHRSGGNVSLKTSDGSTFTLEVPPSAVEGDTNVTMTAVKSIDGAPLDNNSPAAVQLEPSGLFFKEMATLTIIPGKEIPLKQQVAFGYEGDGKDYKLALVDPKSKEVKIKLMRFSGAGVGSGSDAAWAANLMIQSREAADRIEHKIGGLLQHERFEELLGDDSNFGEVSKQLESLVGQWEDQVVRKKEVAAELDCKHASGAAEDLAEVERTRQLLGYPGIPTFQERLAKLQKIFDDCPKNYRVDGDSAGAHFSGNICGTDKPFELTVTAPDGVWPMRFTPTSKSGGTMEGGFSAHYMRLQGSGPYTIAVAEGGAATLQWSFTSTGSSMGRSMTNTKNMSVPLQPAADGSCK